MRIRELEEALAVGKAKAVQRDSELQTQTALLKRERTERQHEQKRRAIELEELSARVGEADRQRDFYRDCEDSLRAELRASFKELETSRVEASNRIRVVERERQELRLELDELKCDAASQSLQSYQDRTQSDAHNRIRESELEAALAEVAELRRKCEAAEIKLTELDRLRIQVERSNRTISELERRQAGPASASVSIDSGSAADARRIRFLEHENQKLRKEAQNTTLLSGKLQTVEEQLSRANQRVADCSRLTLENQELLKLKREWDDFRSASGSSGSSTGLLSSPMDIARTVAELQQQLALAKAESATQGTENRAAVASLAHANRKLTDLEKQLQQVSDHLKEKDAELLKKDRRLMFTKKENDGLKEIVESYSVEATAGTVDGVTQHRLLQKQTEEARVKMAAEIEVLEEKLKKKDDELRDARAEALRAAAAITAVIPKKPLNPAVENHDIANLSKERLDHDPRTRLILHMKENPVIAEQKRRAAELIKLRDECTQLRLQVETGTVVPGTPAVTKDLAKEIEALREERTRAETKNERLKQVYSKMVQEFREACYEITGYRIDVLGGTQYRLHSMYAENEEDSILFQSSRTGIELLDTPFSRTLNDQVAMYLGKFHSIPSFLAAVTMDLFSRTTMA